MIVFAISGHGFGHASRDIEVVNALLDRRPDLPIAIRTSAQPWLFELTLRHPVPVLRAETDTGIAQIDSLRLDAAATVRHAAAFYRDFDRRTTQEAGVLSALGARLVVADIPPLACRAAARAGVPAIALGNFTWDWIYQGYGEWLDEAPGMVDTISRAYETVLFAIRLPMHGGFAAIGDLRDVPFVARESRRSRADVRRMLGLDAARRVALVSFGGHGLIGLDLGRSDAAGAWTIVTTGHVANADGVVEPVADSTTHVVTIDERKIYDRGIHYEDLVAAADVVVTKPGYGIISECLASHTAMLYTSRGHFVEYDVLVAAMPRFLRARFISHDDLYAGRWLSHLEAVLTQQPPPERPPTNGAEIAADMILDVYDHPSPSAPRPDGTLI